MCLDYCSKTIFILKEFFLFSPAVLPEVINKKSKQSSEDNTSFLKQYIENYNHNLNLILSN